MGKRSLSRLVAEEYCANVFEFHQTVITEFVFFRNNSSENIRDTQKARERIGGAPSEVIQSLMGHEKSKAIILRDKYFLNRPCNGIRKPLKDMGLINITEQIFCFCKSLQHNRRSFAVMTKIKIGL